MPRSLCPTRSIPSEWVIPNANAPNNGRKSRFWRVGDQFVGCKLTDCLYSGSIDADSTSVFHFPQSWPSSGLASIALIFSPDVVAWVYWGGKGRVVASIFRSAEGLFFDSCTEPIPTTLVHRKLDLSLDSHSCKPAFLALTTSLSFRPGQFTTSSISTVISSSSFVHSA